MSSRLSRFRRSVGAAVAGVAGLPTRTTRLGGVPTGIGAYDAGRITRKDPDFVPRGLGPNAMAEVGHLDRVVARSRDLFDNHPLIEGGINAVVDSVVGCGISFEADTGDEALDAQIDAMFEWAAWRVDADRDIGLWESQRLFLTEVVVAGDVLCYFPHAGAWRGWPSMPAIELIDRERLQLDLTGFNGATGNHVRQGVEYDGLGRVVAYHVLTVHPRDGNLGAAGWGSWGIGSPNVKRLPVEDVELAFPPKRVNQLRGVPRTTSAMGTIRMEDGFQEDAMLQARTATGFGVIMQIKGKLDAFRRRRDGKLTEERNLAIDAEGNPAQRIQAGSITFVNEDTSPFVVNPGLPGPQFETTMAALQRRSARPLGVKYSTYSGDSSRSNFSSSRGDELDSRKVFKPTGKFVWEHHTDPWRRRMIRWGLLTGRIKLTTAQARGVELGDELGVFLYRCNVQYQGFNYVNPAQEAMATQIDVDTGVMSVPEAVGERGGNWRQTARAQAQYEAFLLGERRRLGVPDGGLRPVAGAAKQDGGGAGGDGAKGDGADGGGTAADGTKTDGQSADNRADGGRAARSARIAALSGLMHLERQDDGRSGS